MSPDRHCKDLDPLHRRARAAARCGRRRWAACCTCAAAMAPWTLQQCAACPRLPPLRCCAAAMCTAGARRRTCSQAAQICALTPRRNPRPHFYTAWSQKLAAKHPSSARHRALGHNNVCGHACGHLKPSSLRTLPALPQVSGGEAAAIAYGNVHPLSGACAPSRSPPGSLS